VLTLRSVIVPLRVFLVVLFALLSLLQTMSFPGQFAHMAEESPELAFLRWPLTLLAAFWLLCAQIVVVCTWKLLTLVTRDRIFSNESFTWVDGILAAVAAAWLALVGAASYFGLRADDPSTPIILVLLTTMVSVAALLMFVMRSLLRQATTLRTELEVVI
jgi:hypothetical protein